MAERADEVHCKLRRETFQVQLNSSASGMWGHTKWMYSHFLEAFPNRIWASLHSASKSGDIFPPLSCPEVTQGRSDGDTLCKYPQTTKGRSFSNRGLVVFCFVWLGGCFLFIFSFFLLFCLWFLFVCFYKRLFQKYVSTKMLFLVFERLWVEVPSDMKKVNVMSISKKGKQKDLFYCRLVSPTSVTGHVMREICLEVIFRHVK